MPYNPLKKPTPPSELSELPLLIVDRQPDDAGAHWGDHFRLIENVLRHDEEVADCAVEFDGRTVLVALTGDMYSADDLEELDARLRTIIGRVACFDFKS